MSGDKLKRVKAVKRWLDKAEDAYTGHQELTGEMNLMMAQAEMQRLKEVHKNSPVRKWGLRGCAMIVAVLLFFGFHFIDEEMNKNEIEAQPPVEIVIHETPTPVAEKVEPPPVVEVPREASAVEASVAAPEAVVPSAPAVPVVAAEPSHPAPPALSDQEIQSVVGEAGRALRGQV